MKIRICLLALLIAALASAVGHRSAYAGGFTAGRLHQLCVSKDKTEEIACRYYLFGAFEGLSFGDAVVRNPGNKYVPRTRSHFCPPDNVSADQLIKIYVDAVQKLTSKSTDYLNQEAHPIADAAFGQAFPCQNQ